MKSLSWPRSDESMTSKRTKPVLASLYEFRELSVVIALPARKVGKSPLEARWRRTLDAPQTRRHPKLPGKSKLRWRLQQIVFLVAQFTVENNLVVQLAEEIELQSIRECRWSGRDVGGCG